MYIILKNIVIYTDLIDTLSLKKLFKYIIHIISFEHKYTQAKKIKTRYKYAI